MTCFVALSVVSAALVTSTAASASTAPEAVFQTAPTSVHVEGNQLVDADGTAYSWSG